MNFDNQNGRGSNSLRPMMGWEGSTSAQEKRCGYVRPTSPIIGRNELLPLPIFLYSVVKVYK